MTPAGGSTIALTGATGFLGSHIADLLLAEGYSVRVSVRPTSNRRWLQDKPLEIMEMDLGSAEDCRRFLAGADALIHCAGVVAAPDEEAYRAGNVTTTATLLEAAARTWGTGNRDRRTFLLVSSLAAHGPAGLDQPAVEDDPCRPITAYGRSKLAAENLVTGGDWPFRTVILRPPGLYGPRDREFLPLFRAAARGFTARLGSRMTGLSLVDGRDAAAAAVALLNTSAARGVFFVDDGHAGYSWRELADALAAALGRKVRLLTIPLGLLKFLQVMAGRARAARSPLLNPDRIRDLDTPGWACDGSRLRSVTGFAAGFELAAGFIDTVGDLRERGLL